MCTNLFIIIFIKKLIHIKYTTFRFLKNLHITLFNINNIILFIIIYQQQWFERIQHRRQLYWWSIYFYLHGLLFRHRKFYP